jgi:hypothetical protein
VLTINCIFREIYEDKKLYSESDKDFLKIQNAFPLNDFEHMNVDLDSNSNGSEYLDSVSNF